ncbi:putative mitochondrial protein, partial [Tanacetum coccineum]
MFCRLLRWRTGDIELAKALAKGGGGVAKDLAKPRRSGEAPKSSHLGEADKIKLVSIHLYDRSLTWHPQFVKTHGEAVTWAEYEEVVLKIFGDANEDAMAELKNLRYKTTMKQ